MTTTGRVLLRALKKAGAKAVFGLPGDYALPFFREIEDSAILPLFTLSHEPGIGFAADGAARQGGGIGVAAVTYGAGAMNMVNPVACAWAEHTPLVVISGAPGTREMDGGLMLHHQIRTPETQMNVFREFTCAQARLDDPETAPEEIVRVITACLAASRPVYIELPRDMAGTTCKPVSRDFLEEAPLPLPLLEAALADISARLAAAKNPAVIAGAQARRFGLEESVYRLAEGWQMPLLTSFMGKGLFAGKGWPHVGTYLGLAGRADLRAMVEDADLLFILGVTPCDTNWGISGKRVDARNAILATSDSVIVCGKKYEGLTVKSLVPALHRLRHTGGSIVPVLQQGPVANDGIVDGPLVPDHIAPILQAVLDGCNPAPPLVTDIGDCLFMAMAMERLRVLASGYYATMGFGIPAALGLQAATGERPVVLVGDGGFQMTGWELLNCPRHGLDPVVIVLNNGSWEMLRRFQPEAGYVSISGLCYADLARDMGGAGVTVRTAEELRQALGSALGQRGKFQLIESVLPAGRCTSTMQRFTEAIRKSGT